MLALGKRVVFQLTILSLEEVGIGGVLAPVHVVGLRLLVVEVMEVLLGGLAQCWEAIVGDIVREQACTLAILRTLVEVLVGALAVAVAKLVASTDVRLVNFDFLLILLGVDGHKRSVALLHVRRSHHKLPVARRLLDDGRPDGCGLVIGLRRFLFVVRFVVRMGLAVEVCVVERAHIVLDELTLLVAEEHVALVEDVADLLILVVVVEHLREGRLGLGLVVVCREEVGVRGILTGRV